MQINPGGRLDTKDIIGRDNEIDRYWHILKRQGLVLSAERRIGKTHILFKMREEYQAGYVPFYQDLEAVHSVAELIRSIYATVENSSGAMPKVKAYIAKRSTLLPKRIGGIDLPTADGTWQTLLADVFDILIRSADDNTRILMLWDEFPLMLHNLQRNAGPDTPIQLLDYLRALRIARADRLRFLFTGSVGLHLVLRSLREAGSTNDPVNDMLSLTVPPIVRHHTCELAEALLRETRAAPLGNPRSSLRNRRSRRWVSVLRTSCGRPARPAEAETDIEGRVCGCRPPRVRPPRPCEPQVLSDPPVFVLCRRSAAARPACPRHLSPSTVRHTLSATPQPVQARQPTAGE